MRYFSILLSFGGTFALHGNLTTVLNTINEHNKEMVFLKGSKAHADFPDLLETHLSAEILNEYGCWCYRGRANVGKGRGVPVDHFDELCKQIYQAYECVWKDAPLNGAADCDPLSRSEAGYTWEVEYEIKNMKVDTILTCTGDGSDWCGATICEIDMMYAKLYMDLIMDGEEPNYEAYGHDAGFNPSRSCAFVEEGATDGDTTGSGGATAPGARADDGPGAEMGQRSLTGGLQPYKKCCGMYPHRWIYRTDHQEFGSRQCCDLEGKNNIGNSRSRTFMSETHVCCGEQGVQAGYACL